MADRKTKTSMKNLAALIIVVLFIQLISIFVLSTTVFALSGRITEDPQLYFTGTSTDPSTLYQDGIDGNSDVGLEICDVGARYVGLAYALRVGSSYYYVPISYYSSSTALSYTDTQSGSCYQVTPGFVTVSPSQLTTPEPDVYKAAFPGNLWIGYDAGSGNPGTIGSFVFGGTSAQLQGSYSIQRSFSQTTRTVSVSTPQITFQTSSGSFSKSASDTSYGISSDRRMVLGLCDDSSGSICNQGEVLSSAVFPREYSTGLSASQVNDQNTYTKYVVANGMGNSICIGANLKASISQVNPNPIYYSQTLGVNITITNPRNTPYETFGGNVDVTSDFDVLVRIHEKNNLSKIVYTEVIPVTNTISPDGTQVVSINWPAYAKSGLYTVRVEVDSGADIAECDEGDNIATADFELRPITLPDIFIDGVKTETFQIPNVPYNLSFHFKNSDNLTLSNATVRMSEQNGLNLMGPTQIFNKTINGQTVKTGIVSKNSIEFISDKNGNATLTFIPTYNPLYVPRYNYTDLSEYIGNYSLSIGGSQEDGENFMFVINGALSSEYYLNLNNTDYQGVYVNKNIENKNIVSQVMDFIYHTFSNFVETVVN